MTREEAIAVVAKAIRSGIFNDLGSGSNVDLCVISEGGKKVDYLRNYEKLQGKTYAREQPVIFAKGTARTFPCHAVQPVRSTVPTLCRSWVASSCGGQACSAACWPALCHAEPVLAYACERSGMRHAQNSMYATPQVMNYHIYVCLCTAVAGERIAPVIHLDEVKIIEGAPMEMDVE